MVVHDKQEAVSPYKYAGASVTSTAHATMNTGIEVIVQHVCNGHYMTY